MCPVDVGRMSMNVLLVSTYTTNTQHNQRNIHKLKENLQTHYWHCSKGVNLNPLQNKRIALRVILKTNSSRVSLVCNW